MFFELSQTDLSSYAHDNTRYVEAKNIDEVITILENDSIQLLKWFSDNQMKDNKDKCHLVFSNNEVSMKIDNTDLEKNSSEKLLDIIIDSKFNFKEHLERIIKKASRNVDVLTRITPHMNRGRNNVRMSEISALSSKIPS